MTHNHYDHMDLSTLKQLWETHRPRLLMPLGNDTILRAGMKGVPVTVGDWWDSFDLSGQIRATVVPSYHWSSRGLRDHRMALWGGFFLETPRGSIYCAGDTAYGDGAIFSEIGRRCGTPDVAVLPIGAYAPRWFMQAQHADPEESVRIAKACGARNMLGVHWGTFPLTDESFDEPQPYYGGRPRYTVSQRKRSLPEILGVMCEQGETCIWIGPEKSHSVDQCDRPTLPPTEMGEDR